MSQLRRVIAVMCDGKERTLRQIEAAIYERTWHGDTQAAISARLREVWAHGWEKQRRCEVINGKQEGDGGGSVNWISIVNAIAGHASQPVFSPVFYPLCNVTTNRASGVAKAKRIARKRRNRARG